MTMMRHNQERICHINAYSAAKCVWLCSTSRFHTHARVLFVGPYVARMPLLRGWGRRQISTTHRTCQEWLGVVGWDGLLRFTCGATDEHSSYPIPLNPLISGLFGIPLRWSDLDQETTYMSWWVSKAYEDVSLSSMYSYASALLGESGIWYA